MSRILELYKSLYDNNHRFLDEIFAADIYSSACPKFTIVDLGAFEGEFGFYCYNFAKEIYAIEPDPRPFSILKENVEKFGLDKFKIYPDLAISGRTEERKFVASGYGGSGLKDYDGATVIKTMSLADFVKQEDIKHIDILKIDVEGAEYEIFKADDFAGVAPMIDKIVGEAHSGIEELKVGLEPFGFKVTAPSGCFLAER